MFFIASVRKMIPRMNKGGVFLINRFDFLYYMETMHISLSQIDRKPVLKLFQAYQRLQRAKGRLPVDEFNDCFRFAESYHTLPTGAR